MVIDGAAAMNPLASRRDALRAGACAAGAAAASGAGLLAWRHWRPNAASGIVSAATRQGTHLLARLDLAGRVVWQLPLPVRAHGLAVHGPDPHLAVAVARRPGTLAWMVDLAEGRIVLSLPAQTGRHYFGHAVFSPDGKHLLTTENDYERGVGVIGVRDASTGQWLGEVSSHGIGPHELRFGPGTDTLVIANGGIHTHPSQQRENLNPDTMAPNLVRLDWGRQRLISMDQPVHHQLSIRHIDVTPRGDVAAAMQFEGAASLRATLPTLALRRGAGLEVPAADASTWAALGGYVGSVRSSPDGDWAVATSPRGNALVFWDLQRNRLHRPQQMADVCGVCFSPDGDEVLISAGSTAVRRYRHFSDGWRPTPSGDEHALQWDNHADWI